MPAVTRERFEPGSSNTTVRHVATGLLKCKFSRASRIHSGPMIRDLYLKITIFSPRKANLLTETGQWSVMQWPVTTSGQSTLQSAAATDAIDRISPDCPTNLKHYHYLLLLSSDVVYYYKTLLSTAPVC